MDICKLLAFLAISILFGLVCMHCVGVVDATQFLAVGEVDKEI